MFIDAIAGMRKVAATGASVTGLPSCMTIASTLLSPLAGALSDLNAMVSPLAPACGVAGSCPHAVPSNSVAATAVAVLTNERALLDMSCSSIFSGGNAAFRRRRRSQPLRQSVREIRGQYRDLLGRNHRARPVHSTDTIRPAL